jgi:PPE-repeat protein
MDFGALLPEINSACMYAGAGATPLLAAAAAWNGISDALNTAASSFESIITRLSTEHWMGPASQSMVAAAQPLLIWLTYTAESSALASAQAMASAAAFETALARTVPPAEVAANRAQFAALTATNILGQNVPAIAATEARYGEMWAQDASAMYTYAASSATAARLNPLARPSNWTDPVGITGQAAAVGRAAHAVKGLSSAEPSTDFEAAPGGLLYGIDGLLGTPALHWMVGHNVPAVAGDYVATTLGGIQAPGTDGLNIKGSEIRTAPGAMPAAAVANTVTPAGVGATPLVTGVGNAPSVGRLSVPPSWFTAAAAMTAGTASDGTGWVVPEDEATAAMPPAPGMVGSAGDDAVVRAGPRYGVKPIVMPKQGLF